MDYRTNTVDCKGVKYTLIFGQNTGIQKKFDTTCGMLCKRFPRTMKTTHQKAEGTITATEMKRTRNTA